MRGPLPPPQAGEGSYADRARISSLPCLRGRVGVGAGTEHGRRDPVTALPSFDITGEVALVTGASSGIGRHFAEILATAGARVALAARRTDRLAELARDIEARDGMCLPIECDVTKGESIATCIAAAEAQLGPLSI